MQVNDHQIQLSKAHFIAEEMTFFMYTFSYFMFCILPLFESMQNYTRRSMFFECLISGGVLLQISSLILHKSCISAGLSFLIFCMQYPQNRKSRKFKSGLQVGQATETFLGKYCTWKSGLQQFKVRHCLLGLRYGELRTF